MTDRQDWLKAGLIPGPLETEVDFERRVRASPPLAERAEMTEALDEVERLFGLRPNWVRVHYSRKGLPFWMPACTWLEWDEEGRLLPPWIQLHPKLKNHSYLWGGLYSRKEILAHELIHAVRAGFSDGAWEEVLAYQSSSRPWRRALGAMFQSTWEAALFMLLALGCGLAWLLPSPWNWLPWISLASAAGGLALKALIHYRRYLKASYPLLALWMTAEEMTTLAQGNWPRGDDSLRWQLIKRNCGVERCSQSSSPPGT